MSKISAIILCLVLTFWNISQNSKVWAASIPKCSDIGITLGIGYNINGINYNLDPNTAVPENTDFIYFALHGLADSSKNGIAYRLDFNYGSTTEQTVADGLINPLATNNAELLKRRLYQGAIKQAITPGKYEEYCTGVSYRVGITYDLATTCQITIDPQTPRPSTPNSKQSITANISKAPPGKYTIIFSPGDYFKTNPDNQNVKSVNIDNDGNGHFEFTAPNLPQDNVGLSIFDPYDPQQVCSSKRFNVKPNTQPIAPVCRIYPNSTPTILQDVSVIASNLESGKLYRADIINKSTGRTNLDPRLPAKNDGTTTLQLNIPPNKLPEGVYFAEVYKDEDNSFACKSEDFTVGKPGVPPLPTSAPCKGDECTRGGGDSCDTGGNRGPGLKTAIGCVHTNPAEFVKDLLTWVIGIGGGIAFLMMLLGAFQMLTSAGNPETLQAGRDRLTSAIIGLLFIIFSILLLQIIGADILGLEGFK